MKTVAITCNHFQALPKQQVENNNCERQPSHHLLFKDFTVPTNAMIEHEVSPPPHVWDKIVCVLDEQDRIKAEAIKQIALRKRIAYWSIAATGTILLAITLFWL